MNPITLLDQLLADYASPRVRRFIHALVLLVVTIVTVWLGAEGEWKEFGIALVTALYAAANKANTPATDLDLAGADSDPDQGLSYEEAGGLPFPEDDPQARGY